MVVKELNDFVLALIQSVTVSWFCDYCVWNLEVLEPQAQNTTSFGYRSFPPDVHLVSAVNELQVHLPKEKQE